MKASMHNGRVGKSEHNDRNFTKQKGYHDDGHIDHSMTQFNSNWQIYNGMSFHENELKYYYDHFQKALDEVNEGYIRNRHPERCKTMEQWLDSLRTGPEESIMQIGNMDDQAAASDLMECMAEFNRWLQEETKGCCVVLDMSLHLDEATPHYQVRRVWQYDDHGTLKIGQEEALKRLGYELPNPEEKKSRYNNRKMVFDAVARTKWYDICEAHGYEIDREPEVGRKHVSKADYVVLSQKKKIAENEEKLSDQERTLQELQTKVEEANNTILSLNRSIKFHETKEERLKERNEVLEKQYSQLEGTVADLKAEISVCEAEKAAILAQTSQEADKMLEEARKYQEEQLSSQLKLEDYVKPEELRELVDDSQIKHLVDLVKDATIDELCLQGYLPEEKRQNAKNSKVIETRLLTKVRYQAQELFERIKDSIQDKLHDVANEIVPHRKSR